MYVAHRVSWNSASTTEEGIFFTTSGCNLPPQRLESVPNRPTTCTVGHPVKVSELCVFRRSLFSLKVCYALEWYEVRRRVQYTKYEGVRDLCHLFDWSAQTSRAFVFRISFLLQQ